MTVTSRLFRAVALGAATAVLAAAAPAAAAPSFEPAVAYDTGSGPFSIAAGDLDRDGVPDLVTVNPYGEQDVSVLLGRGGGAFADDVAYVPGIQSLGVGIGDFTGDGVGDVVASRAFANTVALLAGDGSGGLLTPPAEFAVGQQPLRFAVADLDRDGRLDVAVADRAGDGVTTLLGDGRGGFGAATTYPLGEFRWPTDVATGDLDRDGDLDLVSANSQNASVSVLFNDGNGSFSGTRSYPAGSSPSAVTTGDFDGDGDADVAVANTVNSVSVLRNTGRGTLAAAVAYPVSGPYDVKAADFDGDGDLDLAAAAQSSNTVELLEGDGRGRFAAPTPLPVGGGPTALTVDDLDGDHRPDLASANQLTGDVSVLLNSGEPSVAAAPASHDFGSATVGESTAARTVTISNPGGNAALRVTGLELTGANAGDFEVVSQDCTARAVVVGGSCTVELRARPTAVGARSARLQVAEDAPGEPVSVALAATGVARPVPPPPTPPTPPERLGPLTITGVRGAPRCLAQTGRRRARSGRDIAIAYTLSHAARVTFTLQRRTSPRAPVRRACPRGGSTPRSQQVAWADVTTGQLRSAKARARGRARARAAAARGRTVALTIAAGAGRNSFALSRLLGGKRLAPGAYRISFQAVRSDGARSAVRIVTFPVLK